MIKKIDQNTTRIIIEDFNKTYNLFDHPIKIDDKEFLRFENAIIGKVGKNKAIVRRKGVERKNSNTITSGMTLYPIIEYISKNKSSNFSRLLVKEENTSTSSTLGYTSDPYTGAITTIVGTLLDGIPRGLVFKDNVYLCNLSDGSGGLQPNAFYDGTNFLDMKVPPLNLDLLGFASGTSGELDDELYYGYAVIPLIDGYQEGYCLVDDLNYLALYLTGIPYYYLPATKKSILLSDIPVSTNPRVTARAIYRTIGLSNLENINELYYVTTIHDNVTTTYEDGVSDSALIKVKTVSELTVPKIPYDSKYQINHNGLLVQANLAENLYTPLNDSDITLTALPAGGGDLTPDSTYKYRFMKAWRVGKEWIVSKAIDKSIYLDGSEGQVEISFNSVITNDPYYRVVIVLRSLADGEVGNKLLASYTGLAVNGYSTTIGKEDYPFTDKCPDSALIKELDVNYLISNIFKYPSSLSPSYYDTPNIFSRETIDLNVDDSDEIVGLFSNEGYLDIFKGSSIYKVFTPYPEIEQWYFKKVVDKIGAVENSIVKLPSGDYFFMMNKIGDSGVKTPVFYYWDGDRIPVSISNSIEGLFGGSLYISTIEGNYDPGRNWIWYTVTITNGSSTNYVGDVLIFDLTNKVWYYFHKNTTDLGLVSPYYLKSGEMIFGNTSGRLYKYGNNNQDSLGTAPSSVAILETIGSKKIELDDQIFDVIGFGVNCDSSGAGVSDKFILTPYKNDSVGITPVSKTLGSGINRLRFIPENGIEQCKRLHFEISNDDNVALDILSIYVDIIPEQEESGGANN